MQPWMIKISKNGLTSLKCKKNFLGYYIFYPRPANDELFSELMNMDRNTYREILKENYKCFHIFNRTYFKKEEECKVAIEWMRTITLIDKLVGE